MFVTELEINKCFISLGRFYCNLTRKLFSSKKLLARPKDSSQGPCGWIIIYYYQQAGSATFQFKVTRLVTFKYIFELYKVREQRMIPEFTI